MEGVVHSNKAEPRPQLLDLIPNKTEWMVRDRGGGGGGGAGNVYSSGAARVVEKQLELRLGPPGEGDDLSSVASSSRERMNIVGDPSSLLSLGLFSGRPNTSSGAKRGFLDTLEDSKRQANFQPQKVGFFGSGVVTKEEAAAGATHKAAAADCGEKQQQQHRPAAASPSSANAAAAGNNSRPQTSFTTTQSRPSQPPVVGWPPVRSFRKNITAAAASSSKPPSSSPQNDAAASPGDKQPVGGSNKSMLVKINMDGVPIGRKVDLSACSGYEGLSAAVDQLFRGLLAAQRVMIKDHAGSGSSSTSTSTSCSSSAEQQDNTPAITGLLDGSGEYTLVYEDNEGDRVLVGDVPWEMFVSTVKRLRVLKSSDLPSSLSLGVATAAGTRNKENPRDLSSSSPDTAEPKRATA